MEKTLNQKIAKPTYEAIAPSFGHSFTYRKFDAKHNNNATAWHYHPELELVFVNGGNGKRQIGAHLSYYTEGDLILIGSNLPHCGFTDKLTGNKTETVIQFKGDFLGNDFLEIPEAANLKKLFQNAQNGIAFTGTLKQKLGEEMEAMEHLSQFEKLLSILHILNELAITQDYQILNAEGFTIQSEMKDNDRIQVVFNYVRDNFKESIPLEIIADKVSMTVPSFCRYFKKITNKTFTQFVNEYRLIHASKLLLERPLSITEVCFESGFNNFSHFNKSFKTFTGQNPSEYRKQYKKVIVADELVS